VRKRLAHTEPTAAQLAAIDAEWPLIAAEMDVIDAEITMLYAADRGGPSPMDWRRLRRAEATVTKVAAQLADRTRMTTTRKPKDARADAALPPADAAWLTAEFAAIAAERRDRAAGKAVA
jgi:hypothetical protein